MACYTHILYILVHSYLQEQISWNSLFCGISFVDNIVKYYPWLHLVNESLLSSKYIGPKLAFLCKLQFPTLFLLETTNRHRYIQLILSYIQNTLFILVILVCSRVFISIYIHTHTHTYINIYTHRKKYYGLPW